MYMCTPCLSTSCLLVLLSVSKSRVQSKEGLAPMCPASRLLRRQQKVPTNHQVLTVFYPLESLHLVHSSHFSHCLRDFHPPPQQHPPSPDSNPRPLPYGVSNVPISNLSLALARTRAPARWQVPGTGTWQSPGHLDLSLGGVSSPELTCLGVPLRFFFSFPGIFFQTSGGPVNQVWSTRSATSAKAFGLREPRGVYPCAGNELELSFLRLRITTTPLRLISPHLIRRFQNPIPPAVRHLWPVLFAAGSQSGTNPLKPTPPCQRRNCIPGLLTASSTDACSGPVFVISRARGRVRRQWHASL
ncbi:hypothetical protein B0T26DRAFT_393344 [Lasiosphaeria miniovina]|uniref:Secreted protein n=1 Tax=Lasiosphaeria miniovina TaxID=1954250 RepID=A0AA40A4L3_9PEZI|nr:uncharacterized protein B0T26DRAFT_393344 [Lasiosphaeria miniovina]KAK0709081.1 hypothetical protein B0T26DRAFT_393344 [Lasiosphaeria miniovina]